MTLHAVGVASAGLAGGSTNSSTLTDVEPGLLGFLVVAGLGIALVFLLRSMNKQFKKIGPRPEEPDSVAADEAHSDEGATEVGPVVQGPVVRGAVVEDAPEADTGIGFVPETGKLP